ncbi:MAG TPA: hypothetical protein VND22_03350 [Actinomycetota bacterium]|nr:hypothetical protein [Actinomycetota bacterium]
MKARRTAARWVIVVIGFAAGALFAAGSLLAILFEVQGFPPRDEGPRWYYVAALAAALLVCVGGPFLLMRLLLPEYSRAALMIGLPALVLAIGLLGLTLNR